MAAEDKPNAEADRAITPEEISDFGGAPQVTPAKNAKVLYPARPWSFEPSPWPPGKPPGGKLPPKS